MGTQCPSWWSLSSTELLQETPCWIIKRLPKKSSQKIIHIMPPFCFKNLQWISIVIRLKSNLFYWSRGPCIIWPLSSLNSFLTPTYALWCSYTGLLVLQRDQASSSSWNRPSSFPRTSHDWLPLINKVSPERSSLQRCVLWAPLLKYGAHNSYHSPPSHLFLLGSS